MSKFNVGDEVKLITTTKPCYGWGEVRTGDIGTVKHVDESNGDLTIVFKNQNHWVGLPSEVELVKEEPKTIYASDLMTEARKNKEKYEGKRYEVVVGSSAMYSNGDNKRYRECIVRGGDLISKEGDYLCVFSDTQLEEIKPEPKPVPTIDAVRAHHLNKQTIKCVLNGKEHVYTPYYSQMKDKDGKTVTSNQILNGTWFIEEADHE